MVDVPAACEGELPATKEEILRAEERAGGKSEGCQIEVGANAERNLSESLSRGTDRLGGGRERRDGRTDGRPPWERDEFEEEAEIPDTDEDDKPKEISPCGRPPKLPKIAK